jgi:hypothetical protein
MYDWRTTPQAAGCDHGMMLSVYAQMIMTHA